MNSVATAAAIARLVSEGDLFCVAWWALPHRTCTPYRNGNDSNFNALGPVSQCCQSTASERNGQNREKWAGERRSAVHSLDSQTLGFLWIIQRIGQAESRFKLRLWRTGRDSNPR